MSKNIFEHILTIFYQVYRKYIFLRKEDIDNMTEVLIKNVINSGYKPDIIIAIEKGGLYTAEIISKRLKVKLARIGVSSYSFKIFGIEIEYFPIIKRIANFFGYKRIINLTKELNEDIKNKNVLVVDDECGSGDTIKFVKTHLKEFTPKTIKIAVLVNYYNSCVDYKVRSNLKKLYIMPWEKISPYYVKKFI